MATLIVRERTQVWARLRLKNEDVHRCLSADSHPAARDRLRFSQKPLVQQRGGDHGDDQHRRHDDRRHEPGEHRVLYMDDKKARRWAGPRFLLTSAAVADRPACRCSAWDRPGSAVAASEQAMRASVFRWMKDYLS